MDYKIKKYVKDHKTIYVLSLAGEIDLYNSPDLVKLFKALFAKEARYVILDLQNLDYIDSSGIGVLIKTHTETREKKIRFLIAHLDGSVKKVITLTKLNNFFNIHDTVKDAMIAIIKEG